jgi:hypothetical protein
VKKASKIKPHHVLIVLGAVFILALYLDQYSEQPTLANGLRAALAAVKLATIL